VIDCDMEVFRKWITEVIQTRGGGEELTARKLTQRTRQIGVPQRRNRKRHP